MKIVQAWRASRGILVPTLLIVNTAIIVGVLLLLPKKQIPWRLFTPLAPAAATAESATPPAGPIVRVDDVLVRLRANDEDRYLGAAFDLEIANEKDKDRVTQSMPRIRDAVLTFLSDRSPEDLRGSDRLLVLKQKLLERIHTLVPGQPLKAIYITNLVMQ